MSYESAINENAAFVEKHGIGNAHLVWSIALYLEHADIEALASEALTDGRNDKKIDFIQVDQDARRVVFAQGYYATATKDEAPANKASDLNTAAAWLFSGNLDDVPMQLREIISEARTSITNGDIDTVELLYVHNLPESVNVAKELLTAQEHLQRALEGTTIVVTAKELGRPRIEHLHLSRESHIAIKSSVDCPAKVMFTERGEHWQAYVLSVPGSWLHNLFTKYGDELFSANYRGFLGITKRRKINSGIRLSAEQRPANFWVFNNGITLLTSNLDETKDGTRLDGIAIINGAQTTGSIGSVDTSRHDLRDVRVLCRVIKSTDDSTIKEIVRYNNTQNEITTWDQYSNDPEQARIEEEFLALGHVYSRKRGFHSGADTLCVEDVAQPVVAFAGRFEDANRGKNRIFDRKQTYTSAFAGKKARHILLAYTVGRAVDEIRTQLKKQSNLGQLIEIQEQQLRLLRNLRFKYFLVSVVGKCIEAILGKRVAMDSVAFSQDAASAEKFTLVELVAVLMPVVEKVMVFVSSQIPDADLSTVIGDDSKREAVIKAVQGLVYTSRDSFNHSRLNEMIVPG